MKDTRTVYLGAESRPPGRFHRDCLAVYSTRGRSGDDRLHEIVRCNRFALTPRLTGLPFDLSHDKPTSVILVYRCRKPSIMAIIRTKLKQV